MRAPKKRSHDQDYSGLLVKLLQGFVYREEEKYWDQLMLRQEAVRAYVEPLGLYLYLEEADGYAFLRSVPPQDTPVDTGLDPDAEADVVDLAPDKQPGTLRLMRKIPLSFELSLLCVLLREAIEHFDAHVSDDHRLILKRSEIHDLIKEFTSDTTDEVKLAKRLDGLLGKAEEFGFLRQLKTDPNRFEVRRSIKALIDAQKLGEIKSEMRRHWSLDSTTSDLDGEATL